ncbi:non-homologous end-joining DNA ligase [Streptomyces sp. NPDC059637]|uniref:non-homologous end-joining DNA ligase n=1 Tax=Streptomyces sp. NPDC059637 TaxID=3347752 RepID=UPI003676581E
MTEHDTGERFGAGGRTLTVGNPGKELYPSGFTKRDLLRYLEGIAPVLLPHVRSRPASFKRFPDGTDGEGFFQKNAPRGTPDWVRTVVLPSPGSTKGRREVEYVVVDDLPTLLWAGGQAVLELHVPQWRVGPRGGVRRPDLLVFDLDPGAPATVVECCRVALELRRMLAEDGLRAWPKASGSKGLHLYVPVASATGARATRYARALAERLARQEPDLVVARMDRSLRGGRVFVDWNQNNPARTTVAPYSLRAGKEPVVAAPVSWEEVGACRSPQELRFPPEEVLARVGRDGDPMADAEDARQELPH